MNGISLTSVFWFLAIGFFFYWMMKKGGCGAHARGGHGHHAGHEVGRDPKRPHRRNGAATMGATKDPVCGMGIEPNTAAVMREHMGETFYFCSADCAANFDKSPLQYVPSGGDKAQRANTRNSGTAAAEGGGES